MGQEFVRFYTEHLGSAKPTLPINEFVILYGSCLDAASQESLLAPVIDDTI